VFDSVLRKYRVTSGWKDWRDYCKREGLVEIDSKDSSLFVNRAPQKAMDRLKTALPKAVEGAIRKVKERPYFDRRITGTCGKPDLSNVRRELSRPWK